MIWNPQYNIHAEKIESVQKQFLLFALRRLNWGSRFDLPPYEVAYGMQTLEARRRMLGSIFVFKLLMGEVDSSYLLERISLVVPSRCSRHYIPIYLTRCFRNYEAFDPFRVLCRLFNENYHVMNYCMSTNECRLSLLN